MPRGIAKSGFRERQETRMKFVSPDPTRFKISDCGMYLIEKVQVGLETPVYSVWEYTRVLYGKKSAEEAIAAIKTREVDRQLADLKYWQSREPCAKLVSHLGTYTNTNPTSSE